MIASTVGALQAVNDAGGMLTLLLMDNPAFSGPVRVVSDTRNWVIDGVTYLGLQFRFNLPSDRSKEVPRAQLEIDNTGRELTAELERLPPGAALQATIRLVHRSTPSQVDYEFVADLTNIHTTPGVVAATMGSDLVFRQPAVKIRFDQRTAPGLVPG